MRVLQTRFMLLMLIFGLTGCGVSVNGGYKVEFGVVTFYHGFTAGSNTVQGADPWSFKILDNHYGKDRRHVYQSGELIEGADPATFKVLNHLYSRDRAHGYYAGKKVSDDGSHFVLIPDPEAESPNESRAAYAKDSKRVYVSDRVLEGADPGSFVWVPMASGEYVIHDKVHVWESSYATPLPDVDGGSFRKISNSYFRDRKAVWGAPPGADTHFKKVPLADAESFVAVGDYYGKDKTHVFYKYELVEGADPATFQPPK